MIGIYKITNTLNNKCYIGQSRNVIDRWNHHKNIKPTDHEYDYPLYRAFRKYGIEKFTFEMLEECLAEELDAKEKYWISYFDSYNNGYNQTPGGSGGCHAIKIGSTILTQITHELQTTLKTQKEIATQFNISEEMVQGINTGRYWKRDLSYPLRTVITKPSVCIKCSAPISRYSDSGMCIACFNRSRSKRPDIPIEELVLEIYNTNFVAVGKKYGVSDNAVRKWLQQDHIPTTKKEFVNYVNTTILHLPQKLTPNTKTKHLRRVQQYDINDNFIAEYESLSEAGRAINKPQGGSHISAVCQGKRKSAYGFKWKYI